MSESCNWLWQDCVARGRATLLLGWPKSGRTSLLAGLLREMAGGGLLADRPVQAGRALVVTDSHQIECAWHQFGVGAHARATTFDGSWRDLVAALLAETRQQAIDLVAMDSLLVFPPQDCWADLGKLNQVMKELRILTEAGPAVLLVHYFRRRASPAGRRACGPDLLCRLADFVVEYDYLPAHPFGDRRRRLAAWSAGAPTFRQVIELDRASSRFTALGEGPSDEADAARQPLRAILAAAPQPLSRDQLLSAWPAAFVKPSAVTLYRWLEKDVQQGVLKRAGRGTRAEGFRYSL